MEIEQIQQVRGIRICGSHRFITVCLIATESTGVFMLGDCQSLCIFFLRSVILTLSEFLILFLKNGESVAG